jgi:hypothetical protein
MIKGDKVVCIKDLILNEQTFIKGKMYQLNHLYETSCYVAGENYFSDINYGYTFYFKSSLKSYDKCFSEYFITLSEWREKQINSILDGD